MPISQGIPALSTSGGIPGNLGSVVTGNPLAQIGQALSQLPQQMAVQQAGMQDLGQKMLAPLNQMLAANPDLGNDPTFMQKYTQIAQRYGIYVPMKQQGAPGVGASGMPGTTQAPLPGSPNAAAAAPTGAAPATPATPTKPGDTALSIGARPQPVVGGETAVPGEGGSLPPPMPGAGGPVPATALSQQTGGKWGLDVNAIVGPPVKYVSQLTPADQQYFMSLPSGNTRMQAAQAFGLRGVTPDFINSPMQPRSAAEVDEFSKEMQQERMAVQSGNATPDQWVDFVKANSDRIRWLNEDPATLLADKGVMGQMTVSMRAKLQQLSNQGLISKADMLKAESDASKASTAADLARVQEQYIGAKISVLPQEVQARVETAAAAMANSQAHAQQVQLNIQNSLQGTWSQQQTARGMQQRLAIQTSGIHQWTAILADDQKQYGALRQAYSSAQANKQDPSSVPINVPDPQNPGQTKQIPLAEALAAAQAQVDYDRKQLISTSSKALVTQQTPEASPGSSQYIEGQQYKDQNGKVWTYGGENPDGSPIWK